MSCEKILTSFYAWETVDLDIYLTADGNGEILSDCKDVIVSIAQGGEVQVEKTLNNGVEIDAAEDKIVLHLDQSGTGSFAVGRVALQVNILYNSSERDVSAVGYLEVKENLHGEAME